MPKETPVVVGSDPIEIIGHQRSVRSSRGEPRLVEMSVVETVIPVQHYYNRGCEVSPGGAFPRTAHSRFGVRHKLTVAPNVVIPQRIDNEVSFEGSDGQPEWYTGDDLVPDQTSFWSGYNPVRFRDTTSYAMVALNTCQPYSDENYSYFTAGFPVTVWPMVCRTHINGNVDLEIPEYLGNVLTATAQPMWPATFTLNSEKAFPTLNFGSVAGVQGVTITQCELKAPSSGERQLGHPAFTNRVVRLAFFGGGSGDWDDMPVIINVFCAPRAGSKVRVRVISQVWENVLAPKIYTFPSSDAIVAG